MFKNLHEATLDDYFPGLNLNRYFRKINPKCTYNRVSELLRSIDQHYGRIYEIHPESNMHRIDATNMVIHKVSTYSFQEPQQKFPLEEK